MWDNMDRMDLFMNLRNVYGQSDEVDVFTD